MSQKYSNHLAKKAYYYSTPEQKKYFRTEINQQISKLILHQYASEVIEYIYALTATDNETQRREMVYSFYGQYFLLLKEMDDSKPAKDEEEKTAKKDDNSAKKDEKSAKKGEKDEKLAKKDEKPDKKSKDKVAKVQVIEKMGLKQFCESKPHLAEQILTKIESIVQKLVEKGMSRHSIVQAIICDYILCQKDTTSIKWLGDTMKEKLPSLLASKQGLVVACSLFNLLEAKDRKIVVKSVQEPLKEMIVNKVAHLFILYIINNLDDTVMTKKKLLNDIILTIDDNITDRSFQNIFLGIIMPNSKRYFTADEIQAFEIQQEKTSSKKDPEVRRKELIQVSIGPLEKFYEENMQFYLADISNNPLLAKILQVRIEMGGVNDSDIMDEMFRHVQKKHTKEGEKSQILLGHADLHRVLKELVKFD